MEKELNERDVYEYGDILAEVFGERKIFAHRAVGLEALLCQYMHQMLAKQHQLKIMKKAGKDIQNHFKRHKLQNKDDFHSYDALAVQLEASRLSLEAMYDDIFASQHRILAQLKHVESGGNMTNYSVPTPQLKSYQHQQKPNLQISTKHAIEDDDRNLIPLTPSMGDDTVAADMAAAIDVLSMSPNGDNQTTSQDVYFSSSNVSVSAQATSVASGLRHNTPGPRTVNARTGTGTGTSIDPTSTAKSNKRFSDGGKSARERRREIEQKRLARPSSNRFSMDDEDAQKARNRMRQLEAQAKERHGSSAQSIGHGDDGIFTGNAAKNNEDLKERTRRGTSGRNVPVS
jgi:hypothetical protein